MDGSGSRFRGGDVEEQDYRPVSGLAVAAVVAGTVSAVAMLAPPFVVVPLLAVGTAVLAIRDVSRPELPKVGRSAALVGLALAVGFGCQAAAWHATSYWVSSRRAESVLKAFVQNVREGRLTQARRMLSPLLFAPPASEDGSGAPAGVQQEQAEQAFRESALVREVLACTSGVKAECRGFRPDSKEAKEAWLGRIRLDGCPAGPARVIDMELEQGFRREPKGLVENWVISTYELAPRE